MKKNIFFLLFFIIPSISFSISNIYFNTAPTAIAQSGIQATEQTLISITLEGTDPEDDQLTYVLHSVPANGRVTDPNDNNKTIYAGTIIKTNKIDYISNSDIASSDFFEFKVFDGKLLSNVAKVSISIDGVNDTPIAENATVELTENTPTLITLVGTDPDGTVPSIFKIVSLPITGTLTDPGNNNQEILAGNNITGNQVTYTGKDTSNSDSFLFKVNDGVLESLSGTLSITKILSDSPDATAQDVQVTEQVDHTITLKGVDKEGDPLNFIVNALPSNGTLKNNGNIISSTDLPKNISGSDVVYASTSDSVITDSFTFRSNDGISSSFSAKVSISISPVNDKPIASNQSNIIVFEQISRSITLEAIDPDGDQLVYSIVDLPQNGVVNLNNNVATYTSNSDSAKDDTFTFKANDNILDSEKGTISIDIIQINDAPVAFSQNVSVVEDKSIEIVLTGSDGDGDDFVYSIIKSPINGDATLDVNKVNYKPKEGYFGQDSFIFRTNDGKENSDPASVTITITSNDLDEDGVLNDDDKCPNTPAGTPVDLDGCAIFVLPVNNNKVEVTSATCIGNTDGSIGLSVEDNSYDYTITITGKDDVAIAGEDKTASVTGFAKGTYSVCFKVDGQADYEQCFEVVIGEPKALSAFIDVDNDKRTTSIQLSGSNIYNIDINGQRQQVKGDNFTTTLPTGLSIIKISTNLDCQGVIEREIFISEDIHYYPNPTDQDVSVHVSGEDTSVQVSVFSEKGDLIYTQRQQIQDFSRKTKIDLSRQITGTYIVVMDGPTVRKTFKIVKR